MPSPLNCLCVAVQVPCPDRLKEGLGGYENLQFTLVDCPGHASLIRTIIGGERACGEPLPPSANCDRPRICPEFMWWLCGLCGVGNRPRRKRGVVGGETGGRLGKCD
jgi:hypothetical protein